MNTQEYIGLEDQYGSHNYHPLDVVIHRGHGVWVWDVEGKKYLDFLSGYSALNHGHTHERIVKVAIKQMQMLTLTGRAFRNDQLGLFCKELCEFTGFEKFLPMNSGAEAVETAIKVARKWASEKKNRKNGEIIVCSNNFHGRTVSIISFSTEDQYKQGFGPFTPGFTVVQFNNSNAIQEAVNEKTIGVLVEPIQGEGGIIVPQEGYLTAVAKICRDNGILFMLDEIQTGLGRTGKLFAYEHEVDAKSGIEWYPAKPDILIVGKALGGGMYPVSGVLTSNDIMEVIKPGDHGSTFGGNPLGAAIGREALAVLREENLVENSAAMGKYMVERLQEIESKWIKQIRGKGLFIGIELVPESGGARKFCEVLAKKGLLTKETHDYVIRLSPPLIITKEEIDLALRIIKETLEN
jgi:ornithine--oxo-acid transaminase